MNQITVVDFISRGNSHSAFNKYMITALSSNYDHIDFFGNETHLNKIENKISNIKLRKVKEISDRWFIQLIFIFLIFLLNFKGKKVLILTQDNYFTPLFFILFHFRFRKINKNICFHNNLDGLVLKRKRILFQIFLNLGRPKIICLTENALTKTQSIFTNTNSFFLPHPNYVKNNFTKENSVILKKERINIIILGRQAIHFSKDLISEFNSVEYKHLTFHIFGVKDNLHSLNKDTFRFYTERPTESLFKTLFGSADFAFFSPGGNIFRASGLLMDSITFSCPIIAPMEGHFKEFDDYNIGFFYKNIDELHQLLKEIDTHFIRRSSLKDTKFHIIRQEREFPSISKKICSIIET